MSVDGLLTSGVGLYLHLRGRRRFHSIALPFQIHGGEKDGRDLRGVHRVCARVSREEWRVGGQVQAGCGLVTR